MASAPPILKSALLALWLAVSLSNHQVTADTQDALEANLARLLAVPLPRRDPIDLASRLTGRPLEALLAPEPAQHDFSLGATQTFWVGDQEQGQFWQTQAVLRLVTDHAHWFVEAGRAVDLAALARSAERFEARTYPLTRRYFGSEPYPGIDGLERITVLLASVPGVWAYYSAADQYSQAVQPRSNQREMLYVNLDSLNPGTPVFDATLVHEFQHMVHWNVNPSQETWVSEGTAELASKLLGYDSGRFIAFETSPDVSLTEWSSHRQRRPAHYQAAFLFFQYFRERFADPEDFAEMLSTQARGSELIDGFLASRGYTERFDEVFTDWTVANHLDERFPSGGRYGYRSVDVKAQLSRALRSGDGPVRSEVEQYGTDYFELPDIRAGTELRFLGSPTVKVMEAEAASGRSFWWSNRGDAIDTHMTRSVDLRGMDTATLGFKAWFDLEKDFDYAYVLVSEDAGRSWQALQASHTVDTNPTGNSFGPGYTGRSGQGETAAWIDEAIDLSSFAGREILVRFEYVTDQSYNSQGFAVDDISIPEIAFQDDAEENAGWLAEGFVRTDNVLPQKFVLNLILLRDSGPDVVRLRPGRDNQVTLGLDAFEANGLSGILVISGTTPKTLQRARYMVELALAL